MHEFSLIQALVSRVAEEARRRQALKVHSLSVRVGELSGVEPELLQSAYELFRTGTVCEGAALRVERVPARWGCPRIGSSMGKVYDPDSPGMVTAAEGGSPCRCAASLPNE